MKALQNKEAGAWLNSFPLKHVGILMILMVDCSFQISVGPRLECQLCREFKCICSEFVNHKRLHTLSCSKVTVRYFRHVEVNNKIHKKD